MQFDEKKWVKTRSPACEGSGVAKAIKQINEKCKHEPRDMTDNEGLLDASSAIVAFRKALATAKAKITNKDKKDPATKDLIAEWDLFAKNYQTKLDEQIEKQKGVVAGEIAEEIEVKKAKKALDDVISVYREEGLSKIVKAEASRDQAAQLIAQRDANGAVKRYGAALNYLKDLNTLVTKAWLKKKVVTYAGNHQADPTRFEKDADLLRVFKQVADGVKRLRGELDAMETQIDQLLAQFGNQEPVTTNNDTTYKNNLKTITTSWKGVADHAKQGLGKTKTIFAKIAPLKVIVDRSQAMGISRAVEAVRTIHKALVDAFVEVDSNIQKTIRLTGQGLNKEATDFGITMEDKQKNLQPHTDRAFALNFQCKNVRDEGTEALSDILESIIDRFGTEEAKAALAEINA